MKQYLYSKHIIAPAFLAMMLMTTGCTDNNYDLGDLDKLVAIGSETGIALPGSSTSELKMVDLFDLPEGGVIKIDENTGEYVFSVSDIPDPANVYIEQVEMNKENETEDGYTYDFADIFGDIFGARATRANSDEGMREIKNFSFRSKTPKAIISLNKAMFNSKIDIKLDFSPDLQASIDELKKLEVNVPVYFDLGVEVSQVLKEGPERPYGKEVFDPVTNTMTLTTFAAQQKGVHVIINLKGITFNEGYGRDLANGYYLTMDADSIKMEGGVNMKAEYQVADAARGNFTQANAKNLNIGCDTKVGDITIEGGEGKFNPEIVLTEGMGSFEIKELPEFLNDEDVKLKIKKPRIMLKVSSDIGLEGKVTNGRIIAHKKDGTTIEVAVEDFNIDPHKGDTQEENTTTTILVTNSDAGQEDYGVNYDYNAPVTSDEDLTDLLEGISDIEYISFECEVTTDEEETGTVEMGHEYTIQPDFDFYAPLELEAGSTIVFRDTISGWHEDLKDLRLSHGTYIEFTAQVTNRLPTNIVFEVWPHEIAADGTMKRMGNDMFTTKVWTGNDEEQNLVFAGRKEAPTTTTLHVLLTQTNYNALATLDGLLFRAYGVSPQDYQGETIRNDSNLELTDISTFLKGKVVTGVDSE